MSRGYSYTIIPSMCRPVRVYGTQSSASGSMAKVRLRFYGIYRWTEIILKTLSLAPFKDALEMRR